MACSCLKNDYSIRVFTKACNTLVYEDQSLWMTDEGFDIPDTYAVNMYFPDSSQAISLTLNTKGQNILLGTDFSIDLFLDGIYCFETTSCGVKYKTFKAVLCQAEKVLRELKAKLTFTSKTSEWDLVYKIEEYFEMIHSSVDLELFDNADKLISILNDELQNLNCCL